MPRLKPNTRSLPTPIYAKAKRWSAGGGGGAPTPSALMTLSFGGTLSALTQYAEPIAPYLSGNPILNGGVSSEVDTRYRALLAGTAVSVSWVAPAGSGWEVRREGLVVATPTFATQHGSMALSIALALDESLEWRQVSGPFGSTLINVGFLPAVVGAPGGWAVSYGGAFGATLNRGPRGNLSRGQAAGADTTEATRHPIVGTQTAAVVAYSTTTGGVTTQMALRANGVTVATFFLAGVRGRVVVSVPVSVLGDELDLLWIAGASPGQTSWIVYGTGGGNAYVLQWAGKRVIAGAGAHEIHNPSDASIGGPPGVAPFVVPVDSHVVEVSVSQENAVAKGFALLREAVSDYTWTSAAAQYDRETPPGGRAFLAGEHISVTVDGSGGGRQRIRALLVPD